MECSINIAWFAVFFWCLAIVEVVTISVEDTRDDCPEIEYPTMIVCLITHVIVGVWMLCISKVVLSVITVLSSIVMVTLVYTSLYKISECNFVYEFVYPINYYLIIINTCINTTVLGTCIILVSAWVCFFMNAWR
jgi:hypothetical protein